MFDYNESYGSQLGQGVYECDKCKKKMPNDPETISIHKGFCKPNKKKQTKKK